jgi:hypothetical protein
MRNGFPRATARAARSWVVPVALVLGTLFLIPVGALASPGTGPSVRVVPGQTGGPLSANVSWDGTNISTAGSATSAFHISFGNSVDLYYAWNQPAGIARSSVPWSINDARLQIFYFGFALGTRDVTTATGNASGHIVMSDWNTGPLEYVIEGTYKLTASLLATNGTTAWSQSFWVIVAAAFYVLAALPIVLLLLAVYEIYNVATVGRQQALKRRHDGNLAPPPPSSDASTSTSSGNSAAEKP